MVEVTRGVAVHRVSAQGRAQVEDIVAAEFPLTIVLDGQEIVTLLCTPSDMKHLAIGFLSSEGLIAGGADIGRVMLDDRRGVVRVETVGGGVVERELPFKRLITSGCGRGASFYSAADAMSQAGVESGLTMSAGEVTALVRQFQRRSEMYRATGGVHSAALCHGQDILVFAEDIGRHNAIDKVFGECIVRGIPTADCVVVTSGRISSEILMKVARRDIPMLISRSAATDMAVELGLRLGVTVVGFVRGQRMNVYSHEWRVSDG
ncbi:MAG: formate dehydrogenase accessory sulfurtransferase FdhD [Chloroflexota bacterium]|nr:formate dehydrogenase accessory sulfurtransferase FdhD [Chloroflexota bacterium]